MIEIGDRVGKVGGEYGGPGIVVGRFETEHGDLCYCVAHRIEGGYGYLIHIYAFHQLVRKT